MTREEERLIELLSRRDAGALSDTERAELAALLGGREEGDDLERALAAAANALALDEPASGEAPPASLRGKLAEDAARFFDARDAAAATAAAPAANVTALDARRRNSRPTAARLAGWLGWAVAASLLVAVVVDRQREPGPTPPAVAATPTAPSGNVDAPERTASLPDPVIDRARLMLEAPDAVVLPWAPQGGEAYAGVRGDIVWSDGLQQGYLRLTGMPVNDPARDQYQLWIVDPKRDERPVDGGVFDVPAMAEIVIPVRAKLAVDQPVAFAITREKPGGVVVSEGPLLLVASSG